MRKGITVAEGERPAANPAPDFFKVFLYVISRAELEKVSCGFWDSINLITGKGANTLFLSYFCFCLSPAVAAQRPAMEAWQPHAAFRFPPARVCVYCKCTC